jgi:hypothetical protein
MVVPRLRIHLPDQSSGPLLRTDSYKLVSNSK